MSWKTAVQRQIHRVQKIAMLASLSMLGLNLTLLVFQYVEWRGISPYVGIPAIFLALVIVILAAANVWVGVLRMHEHERRSLIEHNPIEVYAMTPYQVVERQTFGLPMLRAQIALHRELGLDTAPLEDVLGRWERWSDLGYIPRSEYPTQLLDYYKSKGARV